MEESTGFEEGMGEMGLGIGESVRLPGHGMGIGLMICHRIMATHKGYLSFRSADGLIARVTLPRIAKYSNIANDAKEREEEL